MPIPFELFALAENNDEKAVKDYFEQHNLPFNVINQHDITVAHVAARKGNLSLLKYILEKDPSILTSRKCRGEEVFTSAIKYGHLDVVKYLVETLNQDIEKRFSPRFYGNTAIHLAVEWEELLVLKYFLEERNGNVNVLSDVMQTPVFLAVENRFHAIAKYLIEERGAAVNKVDYMSETILDKAANANDFDMMRYLVNERKMKVTKKWKYDLVFQAASFNRLDLLKYLVSELHAEVNIQEPWGKTPLHRAASGNYYEVCKFLIEHGGANIDMEDIDGITAVKETTDDRIIELMKPRIRRSVSVVEPFLEQGIVNNLKQIHLEHHQRMTPNSNQFHQNFLLLARMLFRDPTGSTNLHRS